MAAASFLNLGRGHNRKGSFADDTLRTFRGNPAHIFYGTGSLPVRLRLHWKSPTADLPVDTSSK